jgi:choline dehydrogenase-like flavoprotein
MRGERRYDVCVIGSGPAGLTIARELARGVPGAAVAVLESGHREPTPFADALRDLDATGISVRTDSRERVFGGTSTTWAGLSSPLDAEDFEPRPWVPASGWPFALEHLDSYYSEASTTYGFPAFRAFVQERWSAVRAAGDITPAWTSLEEKLFLAATEPQRFAVTCREVCSDGSVDLQLDATVIRLEGERHNGRATAAVARGADGAECRFVARHFVLAAGGIENARLLLLSRYAHPDGLGNDHDQVGRYLMNHPKNYHGLIRLTRPVRELPAYFGFVHRGFRGYAGVRLAPAVQAAQQVLNSYVRFEPLYGWSDNVAVESFVFLQKEMKVLLRAFLAWRRDDVVPLRDYSETGDDSAWQPTRSGWREYARALRRVMADPSTVAWYIRHRLRDRMQITPHAIRLRNFMEMAPDPANRVVLGTRRDAFGSPLPVVHHQVGELDRRSMCAVHAALRQDLRRSDWGRLESSLSPTTEPWPINLDASHHLGTTRMGADPRHSVVDAHCRVHGTPNVFVAGGSVFPTAGCANPTFTIVALAIRLGRALATRLRDERGAGASPDAVARRSPE